MHSRVVMLWCGHCGQSVVNGYQWLSNQLSIISGQWSVVASGHQRSGVIRGHHCFESETLLDS